LVDGTAVQVAQSPRPSRSVRTGQPRVWPVQAATTYLGWIQYFDGSGTIVTMN
jgi:hypothetical protein